MRYRVTHKTEFIYESQVGISYNEARLLPRPLQHQQVLSASMRIDPPPNDLYERSDYFGNLTSYFSILRPHTELTITAISDVEVGRENLDLESHKLSWEKVKDRLRTSKTSEVLEAFQFCLPSPMIRLDQALYDYAKISFAPDRPLDEAVNDLMIRIYRDFKYDPEFSTIATPLAEVMRHRSGVCQDFAHLAIGCLRSQGLAARYVSGYIETIPPEGEKRLVGADASHAWFAVFLPEVGWLDYDPTNNQLPADRHITVGWGRDYSDVTPLKGVAYGGGEHELKVAVDVLAQEG
ncbi:MAG: transglutaminase family protein [Deltaproteobacteria bacterium]|jgi:transglutaminase-like putative cysteine protease|nr:transglutaminase family protein [Deltaproteobacteria bacterium]MBW2475998.1 transglutaminase family protein [Deltaproteobacteria bacterium]